MSNNSFRKGLVGAALLGLGASVIAGTPAFAATITLTPSAGSTYTTVLSSSFDLNSIYAPGTLTGTASDNSVSYLISNPSGATLEVGDFNDTGNYQTLDHIKVGTSSDAASASATSFVVKSTGAASTSNDLVIKATSATADVSVTVQAFTDTVRSTGHINKLDSDVESASPARTVNFITGSEVTQSVALKPLVAGSPATATVTFGNINVQELDSSALTAVFKKNGGTYDTATVALNDDNNGFLLTADGALSASDIVSVKAKLRNDLGSDPITYSYSNTDTSSVLANSTAGYEKISLSNSANIATNDGDYDVNKLVRAGTTSVSFVAAFTKDDAKSVNHKAVDAGEPVHVTVTKVTLASASTVSLGGKTLKSTDSSVDYYTTTDANGKLTLPLTATGKNADEVRVTIAAVGTEVAKTVDLAWQTAAASSLVETSAPLSGTRAFANGGSVNVAYALVDQFGQLFTKKDYSYRLHIAVDGSLTPGDQYAAFSNGVASATIIDNDPSESNNISFTASYQSQTGTDAWSGDHLTTGSVTIYNHSAAVPSKVSIDVSKLANTNGSNNPVQNTGVPLAADAVAASDLRVDANTHSAPGFTSATGVRVTGVVKVASGANAGSVPVTISGNGLAFTVTNADFTYSSLGSITVNTNESGVYTVYAFSNTAGDVTVSVASGSVVKTETVTFASAAPADGATLAITAPAVAQNGTAVSVSALLVDAYGNPVTVASGDTPKFSLSVSGIGSATAVTTTDANGKAYATVTFGANEIGTATITATYKNVGSDTLSGDVVKATATIAVSDLAKAAADKAAADKAASAKTVTATTSVTSSQVGRAVDVSVKALNTAGTAAAGRTVTFASTGAGSLTATSAVTDANGVATVKLLAGVADNGDAVVTATVDGVKATAGTVTFGTTDAQLDIVANRVTAVASYSKGKTVALYVDGVKVWSKLSVSDSDVVLNYNLKKGAHTVAVKISGGFVTTEKFIVK